MEDIYCVDNLYNNLFELKEKFIERFKQYQKPLIRNIYNEEEHEREISEYEKKIKIRLNNMILEEIIQENINLFNEQSEREEYIKYVKDFISK